MLIVEENVRALTDEPQVYVDCGKCDCVRAPTLGCLNEIFRVSQDAMSKDDTPFRFRIRELHASRV